ncbi:MAG TPA: hypothetical protein VHT96_09630 [Clostridia bacterium]|nr:hypothetical protein [Clostridia bacterium]
MKGSKLISKLLIVAGLIMVLAGGMSVYAATNSGTQTLGFSNALFCEVTLSAPTVTISSFTRGAATAVDGGTVTGNSNGPWNLSFSGTDFSDGTNTLALTGNLNYRIGTEGSYNPMQAGTAYPINGGTPHAMGSGAYTMGFELTVPTGLAGSELPYEADMVYTISNN